MKNVRILIKISLKFAPKDPINNIPALVDGYFTDAYASLGLNEFTTRPGSAIKSFDVYNGTPKIQTG